MPVCTVGPVCVKWRAHALRRGHADGMLLALSLEHTTTTSKMCLA